MPAPALLVAIPLVAGVVAGALSQAGTRAALCVLALVWVAAAAGLWRRRALVVTAAIVAASFCAGLVRGSGASRAAASPSLLTWFHESPSHADPVILTAVLREDAAPGANGVSVVADALSIFAAILAVMVVGDIDQRQEETSSKLHLGKYALPPSPPSTHPMMELSLPNDQTSNAI